MSARVPAGAARPHIEVGVARTLDDMLQVFALRSVVYMAEQRCPYKEEFDGNDFAAATHVLARIDGEPAGTMRLRWFAEFVKVERVAVKPDLRGGAVAAAIIDYAVKLAERKGYRKVLGHIQARLVPFWLKCGGARVRRERPRFRFSDHDYVEVERDLAPPKDALSFDTPAMVLLRPEGAWDDPGVLDASVARPATNPAA
jgi:predicted GNAT family N-acyltransferase